ncbi:MotA/TolQ/ExbB proton channel family protein [Rhodopila globiformis]|nr:MotA/TolQ/ExbB proton channel family protein [Rhodopila globiformis]
MAISSAEPRSTFVLGTPSEARDFMPLLRWLILMSLTGFGCAALWQLGLIQAMLATDRTHISFLIILLFVFTSLHCLAQNWFVSRELAATRRFEDALHRNRVRFSADIDGTDQLPKGSMIANHVANVATKARVQGGRRVDQSVLLRVLINRLRGRERFGLFVSEALLRLALLGTAVGFILMLIPMAGLNSFDAETLRKALSGMSGGMAVALNITVTGIATALLLKLQYFFLATGVVELFDKITEVTEVHVVPALEHTGHA